MRKQQICVVVLLHGSHWFKCVDDTTISSDFMYLSLYNRGLSEF